MEEEINLATFTFDVDKLNASMDILQNRTFELKKEQEGLRKAYAESQKEINALAKINETLASSSADNSTAIGENNKRIQELTKSQSDNYKAQQNLTLQTSRVRQEITATTVQLKAYMTSEAQQTTLMQSANVALSNQITNINQARASNTELLRVRNQLNPSIEEERVLITSLNDQLDKNNQFIKENASAYEQQKINIGNYSESIKTAFADLNIFNGGLTGFISRSQEAGGVSNLLGNSLKSAGAGFAGLTKSALAFIATPVGALLAVVAGLFLLVKNAMDKNIESADKVNSVFRTIGSVFNSVLKVLEPLGTFIIDVLVGAFEMVGDVAEKAMGFISAGLDLLGFKGAAEDVREFTEGVSESARAANRLEKAERELDIAQKRLRLTQLEYQKGAEVLRQQRDDESRSINDRIKSNRELSVLLDEQLKKELAVAMQARQVAIDRAKENQKIKEQQDDFIEAEIQIADIQERITGQRSEQMANENSLRREAQAQQKAINDKAIADAKARMDASIKAMQTELDFYLESQGERKRSMQDQLEVDKEVMRQSLAINKAEYDAKKLTRREYELANLEIQNEFASKQVEATIENANLEFELFKLNNQRKIDENQFFSDELYNQELDRINKIAEAEAAQQTLAFENGLITAQEYGLAIAQIDDNQRKANEIAEAERNQAIKDQQAADIIIQDELNAERFEYDLALQMERYNREYAERKAQAEKNGADMLAFEQSEAIKKKAIEQSVQENKLQLASQTLNNLSSLLGKESAAGKALAIAQTTMDTYRSATAAYAALAGIPIVGPALGGIAAGVAVASGLANVKKIASTKEAKADKAPGYALGGKIVDGIPISRANGDNVLIAAKRGEAILNESQQRAIGASNLANAGVSGFSASGSSFVQNELTSTANNEAFISAMSDAVYLATLTGSSQGSEKGLTNLSDNRQIMENAKF